MNSHRARMLLPGVADLDTLRYFGGPDRRRGGSRADPDDRRRRHHPVHARAGAGRCWPPEALRQLPRRPCAAALRAAGADPAASADVVRGPPAATDGGRTMSWLEPDDGRWDDPRDDFDDASRRSWPLDWRSLYPRERWMWFEQLWTDVAMLRERYRLAVARVVGGPAPGRGPGRVGGLGAPLRLGRLERPAGQARAAL